MASLVWKGVGGGGLGLSKRMETFSKDGENRL